MLVEDDNNLREIYEARLLAEGYEIVAAKDGEEALALAVKEKPDLIISDVMMPKISGFDMLDILRSTPETKNTKVIMMTALSQAEDKARADKLGADRYLVKSQVTLEDVAKTAHDVLEGTDSAPNIPADLMADVQAAMPVATATPPAEPVAATPIQAPVEPPAPAPVAAEPDVTPTEPELPKVEAAAATAADPTPAPAEPVAAPVMEQPVAAVPEPATAPEPAAEVTLPPAPTPVAEPIATPEAAPAPTDGIKDDLSQTTASESAAIDAQIDDFVNHIAPDPNTKEAAAPGTVEPVAKPIAPSITAPSTDSGTATGGLVTAPVEQIEVATAPDEVAAAPQEAAPVPIVEAPAPVVESPNVPTDVETGSVTINNKKIITPLNDVTKGPDLGQLLQDEDAKAGVTPPPATSIVSPGGQTVTPPIAGVAPDPTQPGNVIAPGDPSNIAL